MEDQALLSVGNSCLKIIRKIGSGSQASVFQVQDVQSHQSYAMKVIETIDLEDKQRKRVEFEVQSNLFISNQLQSDRFPKMHSFWTTNTSINILFELCQQNAEICFKKLENYNQRYNFLLVMLFDMLRALTELQRMGIIHRDIKPQNILVKDGLFKMADLGLSRVRDGSNYFTNDIGNRLGRSPEFNSGKYGFTTDIWSLGVHIFYLLEGTLPFDQQSLLKIKNNPKDIEKVIASPQLIIDLQSRGRKSKNILSLIHLILSQMIVIEPENRASASKVLSLFFSLGLQQSSPIKDMLCLYLQQRQRMGNIHLISLLAFCEFSRMDGKIKGENNTNKIKICLKVKVTVYQILLFVYQQLKAFGYNQAVFGNLCEIINRFRGQLQCQMDIRSISMLNDIEDALQIYKIAKIKQKFPLVAWIVRTYKSIQRKMCGRGNFQVKIWEIPIQLSKIV